MACPAVPIAPGHWDFAPGDHERAGFEPVLEAMVVEPGA
jgi:hypothetical protein